MSFNDFIYSLFMGGEKPPGSCGGQSTDFVSTFDANFRQTTGIEPLGRIRLPEAVGTFVPPVFLDIDDEIEIEYLEDKISKTEEEINSSFPDGTPSAEEVDRLIDELNRRVTGLEEDLARVTGEGAERVRRLQARLAEVEAETLTQFREQQRAEQALASIRGSGVLTERRRAEAQANLDAIKERIAVLALRQRILDGLVRYYRPLTGRTTIQNGQLREEENSRRTWLRTRIGELKERIIRLENFRLLGDYRSELRELTERQRRQDEQNGNGNGG
ncbi:MAG: hypothetical protein NUW37_08455 [Planctomycetes bacterium]|nr:hypothetical protein [Planctomycetota bacterium]